MKLDRRFFFLIAFFTLVMLACQTLVPSGDSAAPPVDQASQPQAEVLYEDDFSDPSSGWDDVEDTDGITGYRDGAYRILINITDWYFWSTPGVNFSDVVVDVDATKNGGPDNNEYGVICRYLDENNFYIFSISSDGYYGISKFSNGEQSGVGMEDMQLNDTVIKTGNSSNHVRAKCIGQNLSLEVNGNLLVDVTASDFTSGDVGVIASTFEESGVDILFDNFVVTKP